MIQGFPDNASVFPGDTINFYISTDAPQFKIELYRQGVNLELVSTIAAQAGVFVPDHDFDKDWRVTAMQNNGMQAPGWPAYPFNVPEDFNGGVYIAMFIELDQNGNPTANAVTNMGTSYTPTAKALFVVKNPVPGYNTQLLFKLPYFTYQAYNYAGGGSVYQGNPGQAVTLQRPGGGTGGVPWDSISGPNSMFNGAYGNWDPYDDYAADPIKGSPRQVFEHWEAKFISWLEGEGYRMDYCTDMDIHLDKGLNLLSSYSVMISSGHDEYYTTEMRDNLEAYVGQGGNIAFFSGNTCYWRLYFPNGDLLTIDRDIEWGNPGNAAAGNTVRPEGYLTGVSFWNGGERNANGASGDGKADNFPNVGYTIQYAKTWAFENSGLNDGDVFGDKQGLVGYEADGAVFDDTSNKPYKVSNDPTWLTPANFNILGYGSTKNFNGIDWRNPGNLYATMGMYSRVGTVFTGATTDWPRVAWEGEPRTGQITKNVIDRLGGNPKGLSDLGNLQGIVSCDGFFSDDDQFRHAIIGTDDGNITEIFFNPDQGQGQTVLANRDNIIDLGAFYTPDDQYRHVLVLDDSGNIAEIFYNPVAGLGIAPLGNIDGAVRICGFYSGDDNYRHAIVLTTDGSIIEIFYGTAGQGQTQITQIDGVADIGCFYSDDDGYRHVIVGTTDGTITEIYYSPKYGTSSTVIGNVPGLLKVTAFYAPGDNFFNRRIQVLDDAGSLYEFRYGLNEGVIKTLLITQVGNADIGGFFSGDDDDMHCIIAADDGSVNELYFER